MTDDNWLDQGIGRLIDWYIALSPIILAVILVAALFIDIPEPVIITTSDLGDVAFNISCETNSMGQTFTCDDIVYGKHITDQTRVYEGKIYAYRDWEEVNESYIAHRLVLCLDADCNVSVFKGDNNRIGELVNRSYIEYEVTAIWQ